ncbi:MAG: EamA family transporter [Candidatus Saccharibacteria bacterium]|nr:EamA family transporter [Microbacteriaceae bacterium]
MEDINPSLHRGRWILVTAIAPIAWGTNYYVTRQFLPADLALWGTVIRALPAGIILLAIARRRPRGSWWWKSLVLGCLNVGVFFILIYVASQLLPSSVASTVMATSAAVMMLIAWPLLGERPRLFGVIGAGLGFGGVCILLLGEQSTVDPRGVAASPGAMLLSSTGYVLTRRWKTTETVLATTSWQLIAGGLVVLPFAIATQRGLPRLNSTELLGFAYVTIIATALAFVAWFSGLRHLKAGTVGLVGLLNPLTGVLLGAVLASEPFGSRQGLGVIIVLAGVVIGQRGHTSRGRISPRREPIPSPRR